MMKKNYAVDFYLKISAWIFFCLVLAVLGSEAMDTMADLSIREKEGSSVRSIDKIRQLQSRFASKNNGKFAVNFYELNPKAQLDEKFPADQLVSDGYVFEIKVIEATDDKPAFFSITADPIDSDENLRHFYFDSTLGTIRYTEENRPAIAIDPAI